LINQKQFVACGWLETFTWGPQHSHASLGDNQQQVW
jgi:hypothetical protein